MWSNYLRHDASESYTGCRERVILKLYSYIWNRKPPIIVENLQNYLYGPIILVQKTNNAGNRDSDYNSALAEHFRDVSVRTVVGLARPSHRITPKCSIIK